MRSLILLSMGELWSLVWGGLIHVLARAVEAAARIGFLGFGGVCDDLC
jgi:hypothetical protein